MRLGPDNDGGLDPTESLRPPAVGVRFYLRSTPQCGETIQGSIIEIDCVDKRVPDIVKRSHAFILANWLT